MQPYSILPVNVKEAYNIYFTEIFSFQINSVVQRKYTIHFGNLDIDNFEYPCARTHYFILRILFLNFGLCAPMYFGHSNQEMSLLMLVSLHVWMTEKMVSDQEYFSYTCFANS